MCQVPLLLLGLAVTMRVFSRADLFDLIKISWLPLSITFHYINQEASIPKGKKDAAFSLLLNQSPSWVPLIKCKGWGFYFLIPSENRHHNPQILKCLMLVAKKKTKSQILASLPVERREHEYIRGTAPGSANIVPILERWQDRKCTLSGLQRHIFHLLSQPFLEYV